jgi:hypothetical protein
LARARRDGCALVVASHDEGAAEILRREGGRL